MLKFRKIIGLLFLVAFLLLGLSVLVIYIKRDAIKQRAIDEVNQTLTEPVSIASVDISFAKLPRAAVVMREVFCAGANGVEGDTLLYAKRVYLEFNLWELWSSPLVIEAISVEDGALSIRMKRNGKHNYEIWKVDDGDGVVGEPASVSIPSLKLSKMKVDYQSEQGDVELSTQQTDFELNGRWLEDSYLFEIEHACVVNELLIDKQRYLYNEPFKNKLKLEGTNGKIEIREGMAIFSYLTTIYSLSYLDDEWVLQANTVDLVDLNALKESAEKYAWIDQELGLSDGLASIDFRYKSLADNAEYELRGSFRELSYFSKNINIQKAVGDYLFVSKKSQKNLEFNNVKIEFPSGDLSGSFALDDLEKPSLRASVSGELSLKDWMTLLSTDGLTDMKGTIRSDLKFENQFNDLENIEPQDFALAKLIGGLEFKDVAFRSKASNKKLRDLKGEVKFNNQAVDINGLYGVLGSSDLFIDGSIKNTLSGLYFDDQKLSVKGRLVSQQINLEDFLVKTSEVSEEDTGLEFFKRITSNLSLDVMQFNFRTFQAKDIKGALQLEKGTVLGKNVSLKTCDGDLLGNFVVYTDELPFRASSSFRLKDVSIPKIFKSFNNFDQSTLTHEHLEGVGVANVQLSAKLDKELRVDPLSVKAEASVEIKAGALNDFEPMLALSDYVDVEELKQVRFSDLENEISIERGIISIPKMDINSNALDLQITGTHSFDNVVDYSLRLELGDVLFNKRRAKSKPGEFDDFIQEEPDADNLPIYLRMRGLVDEVDISLDKGAMGKAVKQDLQGQKTDLQKIFSPDSVKSKPNKTGIQFTWPEEDGG